MSSNKGERNMKPTKEQLKCPDWWAENTRNYHHYYLCDTAGYYYFAEHFSGDDATVRAVRPVKQLESDPVNKYSTNVGDVYDVLKAFEVTNPALQHLIKKALKVGKRGHKDLETDLQDIIDSAIRAKQLEGF
jgi:hypothetical protein